MGMRFDIKKKLYMKQGYFMACMHSWHGVWIETASVEHWLILWDLQWGFTSVTANSNRMHDYMLERSLARNAQICTVII